MDSNVNEFDSIEYRLVIEASKAVEQLRLASAEATSFKQKMDMAVAAVQQFSARTGTSLRATTSIFKEMDGVVSQLSGQAKMFGPVHSQAWQQVGNAATSGSQKVVEGVKAIRTATSVLISMLAFQAIQGVINFFQGAIDQAKQFETTLYRLANAERQLSLEGLEVSIKGLKQGIEDIKKAFPIFSKEDIAELIGSLSVSTKELGFNEEQILKLGAAVSILNLNSTETESLLQTQAKVTNSLISPQAKSIGALGLSFGKAKIEAKAFQMQLLETGETFDDLTEKEKTEIKYQIVLETAGIESIEDLGELEELIKQSGGDFGALSEYLKSNTAKMQENAAAWKDLQTTIGQVIIPFIPALTAFFEFIANGFNGGKVIIIEFMVRLMMLGELLRAIFSGNILDTESFVAKLKETANRSREAFVNEFFKEMPKDAPDWFVKGWGHLIKDQAETATAPVEDLGDALEELDDVDLANLLDEVQDILDKTREAQEDLDIEMGRKTMDLDVEYDRKGADAYLDYQRKVEDINRETEDEIADIKQKRREEDAKREAEYQNKLWELQQKYLMDLEDALHNRDARQIIRLQRQYAFEKEALERKNALDAQESKLEEKGDIKKARDDQKDKLEDAAIDYQRKLADLNTAKAREQEDLQKWYDREQADLQLDQDRKLQALTEGWVEAGLLTETNAAYIYSILAGYFGPGGLTDQIYAYMRASLAQAMAMAGGIALPIGQPAPYSQLAAQSTPASAGTATPIQQLTSGGYESNQPYTPTFVPRPGGYAEGGAFMATTPQSIKVGERGAEMVQTTPIGRVGNDVNKFFMGAGVEGENTRGEVEIGLTLSPDLEARIIRQSMDATANVVLKVNRTRA